MKGDGLPAIFFCVSWKEEGVESVKKSEQLGAFC